MDILVNKHNEISRLTTFDIDPVYMERLAGTGRVVADPVIASQEANAERRV